MKSFYEEISTLKDLVRRGWKRWHIKGRLESDAEHIFSMELLAMELIKKNKLKLNERKVLKMICFHELCEIDAGDTLPDEHVPKEVKFAKEYKCIKRLATEYEMPEIEKLWLEFEENKTPEAQFVKKLDKFVNILQAKIYAEDNNKPEIFEHFYNNAKPIYDEMIKLKRR